MSAFSFKQFTVEHHKSTFKVNTDAVLLGALCESTANDCMEIQKILEIGCGCGVISLMLAQRFHNATIHAIDIHQPSVEEASTNFENSPFSDRLSVECVSLQVYANRHINSRKYDLIVSNPPYFINALKSPNKIKNLAKHDIELDYQTLLTCSQQILSNTGSISIIAPFTEMNNIKNTTQLGCHKIINIYSNDTPKRVIMGFSNISSYFNHNLLEESNFHVYKNHKYSEEYLTLMQAFLFLS